MHTDADLYAAKLEPNATVAHTLARPYAFLHVVQGELTLNNTTQLKGGDGVAISNEQALTLTTTNTTAEVLLFDLD